MIKTDFFEYGVESPLEIQLDEDSESECDDNYFYDDDKNFEE